ncbi:MAG: hypothetical protein IPN68_03195 [Bacteroidetes bacterium]|nr:hypothetical protein [Bacteroidota bacterium]
MFEYEHTSKFNVSAETRESLVKEIEGDEFHLSPIQGKLFLNDVEAIIDSLKGKNPEDIKNEVIRASDPAFNMVLDELFTELKDFIFTDPKLPDPEKNYSDSFRHSFSINDSRELIIQKISESTEISEVSLLAQYVYRDMERIDWETIYQSCNERNPVCFNDLAGKSINQIYEILKNLPEESVYEGNRLALPDEVWNFKRGDGIEKAILLADIILKTESSSVIKIVIENETVMLELSGQNIISIQEKNLVKQSHWREEKYMFYNILFS